MEGDEGVVGLLREGSEEQGGVQLHDVPATGARGAVKMEESREELFVSDDDSEEGREVAERRKDGDVEGGDDKKKMAMDTTYDGFSIYGRILCLVVKRRGTAKGKELVGGAGQAMMEEWITNTQVQKEQGGMLDE